MSVNNPIVSKPIEPEEDTSLKTIFLLGAGASRPAGIPTINEMTEEFMKDPMESTNKQHYLENKIQYDKKFTLIKSLARLHFQNSDLEHMMSIIISLQDNNETGKLLRNKHWEEISWLFRAFQKNNHMSRTYGLNEKLLLNDLRNKIEYFVRTKCESITSVEYLKPFAFLTDKRPMKIFTLNYDASIEIFAENKNLEYTDGVNPYWNKKDFENTYDINLYKLHGSLYWLRTKFGKILKVPIKGLKIADAKYLTDEPVSEMMIYPAIHKNKQLEAYSWLSQKFRDELNDAELCIIIGYSFRDEDIKNSIMESLSTNQNLWIILVDPNATQIKSSAFPAITDVTSRIATMDMGIEEAVTDRLLHSNLEHLTTARRSEEKAETYQSRSQTRLDSGSWNFIIRNYLKINHDDRVKRIVEELSNQTFDGVSGSFPETIEGIVGPKSLQYLIEYYHKDKTKYALWKKIFLEYCTILEHIFFKRHNSELVRNTNPILKGELPEGFEDNGGSHASIENITKEFEKILPKTSFLKTISVPKLISSLKALDERIPLESGGYRHPTDKEIIAKYQNKDTGIRKSALELIDRLESKK